MLFYVLLIVRLAHTEPGRRWLRSWALALWVWLTYGRARLAAGGRRAAQT